jgi:cobyrinic acid a,c-diamide synthase
MTHRVPSRRGGGLILAAPASGSGKTLLTLGLLRLLRDRGMRVAAAKAGPDYIDPTFHAAASGGLCLNLDAWGMRDAMLRAVVDARGQGASAAALVAGFARHDRSVTLAGVVFNRVAGARHRALLEAALARHLPELPCLGAVLQDPALTFPERHLGLVPAGEQQCEAAIARAADAVAAGLDIARLLALARPPTNRGRQVAPGPPLPPLGRHIAVARDEAFLFAYPSVLRWWRAEGADLSFFSPLADEAPDTAADAVYLPGGYPELHAERLAASERFLAGLWRAAAGGKAIYGECGGYMVLGDTLTASDGRVHRMAGLLPLATSFAERRLHLGYREATLLAAGPLGIAGTRFRGHVFHYATTVSAGDAAPLFAIADSCGAGLGPAGLSRGSVSGSFVHLIDRAED